MSSATDISTPSAGSAKDSYAIDSGVASTDRERVLDVWRGAELGSTGGNGADHARYDWFYTLNPQGPAQISFLRHVSEAAPIGFLGVGARRFAYEDESLSAGVLVDFVVAPQHRSVYPAMKLQRAGRSDALRSLDFLYGLPAPQAVAICKRLEHERVFDLSRFARVIRSQSYLRRHLPRWLAYPLGALSDAVDGAWLTLRLLPGRLRGAWVSIFDARFDALWSARHASGSIVGVRDRAFLEWRFSQQPNHAYRTFVLTRPGSEALAMYFVCEQVGSALTIKDLLNIGTDAEFTTGLLMLVREARGLGVNTLSVEVTAEESLRRSLLKAQFSVRSRRPVFCMIGEPLRTRMAHADFYITQADEDI